MPMKMPIILDCDMSACSYNDSKKCHAMAITVGQMNHECVTFADLGKKGGVQDMSGSVGACKIDSCKFNDSLECAADAIHILQRQSHAECDTFAARM